MKTTVDFGVKYKSINGDESQVLMSAIISEAISALGMDAAKGQPLKLVLLAREIAMNNKVELDSADFVLLKSIIENLRVNINVISQAIEIMDASRV